MPGVNAGSKPPAASKADASHEKGGGGRLLDVERDVPRAVEVAVAPEAGVRGEEAVDEERLAEDRAEAREAAELERLLAVAREAGRGGDDGGVRVERGEEGGERGGAVHERGVGVQEEDRLGRGRRPGPRGCRRGRSRGSRPVVHDARPAARAASAEPSVEALSTTTTGTSGGTDVTAAGRCAAEFHDTIATRTRGTRQAGR